MKGIDPPFMCTLPEADAIVSTGNKNVALLHRAGGPRGGGPGRAALGLRANAAVVPAAEAIQVDDFFRVFGGVDICGGGRLTCRET